MSDNPITITSNPPTKDYNPGKNRLRMMTKTDWESTSTPQSLLPGQPGIVRSASGYDSDFVYVRLGRQSPNSDNPHEATPFKSAYKLVPEDNTIITRMVRDRGITEPKLADSSVITRTILAKNVTEPKLADDSVSTRTILAKNVTEPKLGNLSVSTRTIIDKNVTEPKLGNLSVSTRTIIERAVTTDKIADRSITTDKLVDLNVTTGKLANKSVTTEKLNDLSVTTVKLADKSVTTGKLGSLVTSGSSTKNGMTVTLSQPEGQGFSISLSGDKVTSAVTADKVANSLNIQAAVNLSSNGSSKSYDGSGSVSTDLGVTGVLPVSKGGTGVNLSASSALNNKVAVFGSSGFGSPSVTSGDRPSSAGYILFSPNPSSNDSSTRAPIWRNKISLSEVQATSFFATSDERLKENIRPYKFNGHSILDLEVKEFDYKDTGKHSIGFIAQEVRELFPEIVSENSDGYLSIEETKLVYLLLNEISKLKRMICKEWVK